MAISFGRFAMSHSEVELFRSFSPSTLASHLIRGKKTVCNTLIYSPFLHKWLKTEIGKKP